MILELFRQCGIFYFSFFYSIFFFLSVYYYYNTTEELEATLTCVPEKEPYSSYRGYTAPMDPYIKIDGVRYVFYNHKCNHSDPYGVRDMCESKTECTFNVTNANVGSSCGSTEYGLNGLAGLYIVYHCVSKYFLFFL